MHVQCLKKKQQHTKQNNRIVNNFSCKIKTGKQMAGCTWELGRKQDPRSSVAGGVRAEAVSQQGNGAQRQSFGDAHGCGEADHTGSDHRDPDTFLHPAGGREPTGSSVSTCCNTTCDNRPSYELTIDPTTQSKNRPVT